MILQPILHTSTEEAYGTDLLLCDRWQTSAKHAPASKKNSDINKTKKIKTVTRCRDSRSSKVGKQGRDDSIKQFSTQFHPTYL